MNLKKYEKEFNILSVCIIFILSFFIKDNFKLYTALLLIAYILIGRNIIRKAIKNIARREFFDENTLMSIATLGAIMIGDIQEAVAVMLFYQVGELFQSYAVNRSRKSIADLMDIKPAYANLILANDSVVVEPEKLKINDIIEIKIGEKVPVDCVVIEGSSTIDSSALTGESLAKNISENAVLYSGSVNLSSRLLCRVSKTYKDSTVAKILELVEESSSRKSKSERFITKFSRIYTPIVVALAFFLAVLPPLFLDGDFKKWIFRSLAFLVVSCPCAFVISVPLSFFGGIGACSKNGILVKGANYLENLAKIKTIIFDKTGTLTEGNLKLLKINILDKNYSKEDLIKFASYAEHASNHPIALAIKKEYKNKIDVSKISASRNYLGRGLEAKIEDKLVRLGAANFFENEKLKSEDEVYNIVFMSINNKMAAKFYLADSLKADAKTALTNLKAYGIENTVILSGDRKKVAEKIAKDLNLASYKAELLPNQKVEELKNILAKKEKDSFVAFVGDGINDAPALALADIGISMGSLGSDAAIEASDLIIMNDELNKIPLAIKIARKTITISYINIYFALIVKVSVLLSSALGYTSMWEAVFADVGVTIITIFNSMRTLKIK